ncbi:MAG: helix-turn-helix domain-containing protein [Egibacteraceae bacterium]
MGQRVAIRGRVLAELRILRRLTQEGLRVGCEQRDRHCGLTADRISEYEREVRQPTWPNLLVTAAVLELSDAEWRALVCTPTLDALVSPEPGEEGEVDRRAANQAIGAAFGGLVVPAAALDALQAAVERIATWGGHRVDVGLIADHEQLADAYALLHPTARPSRLLVPVSRQADTLYGLLDRPVSSRLGDRLYVVAAGSHAQAGLLAWHTGDRTTARRYFALATDIAEDSRNDTLHAQVLHVASVAHRKPGGRAATMTAQAVDLAANADNGTRASLHSGHAIRLARGNDEYGFRAHMERADQLRSRTTDGTGFLVRNGACDCSQIEVEFAVGLKILKRGDEALEAFVTSRTPIHLRNRAYMLVKRAEAHLVKREPDPEAACADLVASLELGRDAGAATAVERVQKVRDRFPKPCAGLACLAELDEHLARA